MLQLAHKAAGDLDVRLGGGPTTINEFLAADLVDYLHVVQVPIVLGRGVRLWDGLDTESVWTDVSFFKWWEVVEAEAHFRV